MDRRYGLEPAERPLIQSFSDGESRNRRSERPVVCAEAWASAISRSSLPGGSFSHGSGFGPAGSLYTLGGCRYELHLQPHAATAAWTSRSVGLVGSLGCLASCRVRSPAAASASAWASNACSRTCSAARCLSWARYSRRDAEKSRYSLHAGSPTNRVRPHLPASPRPALQSLSVPRGSIISRPIHLDNVMGERHLKTVLIGVS